MTKPMIGKLLVPTTTLLCCLLLVSAAPRAAEGDAPAREAPPMVTVPAGTFLNAELQTLVATNLAQVGDRVEAVLVDPVSIAGEVAFPGGTRLRGYVRDLKPAGRVKGNAAITLAFNEAEVPGGSRTAISAEWKASAPGAKKRDAWIIGGAAAGGALLGQLIGKETERTLEGAALGGAVGTGVVLANKGRDLVLRPRTILILQLGAPATVRAAL